MFTFVEELFLLSCLDDKGGLQDSPEGMLDLATSAALLVNLALLGKIHFDPQKTLVVADSTSSGDDLLDHTAQAVAGAHVNNQKNLEWLQPLLFQKTGRNVLNRLLNKGALRKEEKRGFLGLSRSDVYLLTNPQLKQDIINRYRAVMVEGRAPDPTMAAFIFLNTTLYGNNEPFITRQEQKTYRQRWDALFSDYWGHMETQTPIVPIAGLDPAAREVIGEMLISAGTVASALIDVGGATYNR